MSGQIKRVQGQSFRKNIFKLDFFDAVCYNRGTV